MADLKGKKQKQPSSRPEGWLAAGIVVQLELTCRQDRQGHDRLLCVAALPPFIRAHVDGCTHAQCHHSDDASAGRSRPQAGGYNMDELNQQEREPEVMRDAWKRAVGAPQLGLAGLLLLLSLACASASAPVTQEPPVSTDTPIANGIVQTPGEATTSAPRVSTGTPVADGIAQTPGQAATPAPRVSTGTPVADGIAQTPGQAATPAPPRTSKATSERTGENQATDNDSKDTSESIPRSGGTGGDSQAASSPRDGDEKAAPIPRSGGTGGDNQAPPIPHKGELRYPNLGSRLDELVVSVEAGETTAEQAAGGAAMHSGASVAVTIYLSGSVDGVVAFLEKNGGDPRNVGEDYVEAYVPVSLLGPVSDRPGVIRVREIVPPEPGRGG